jgi:hypothetical protein
MVKKGSKSGGEGETSGKQEIIQAVTALSPAPVKQTLKEDIVVRLIKMFDMGYTNVLFGIPALFVATFLNDRVYAKIQIGDIKNDEDKTLPAILTEVLICLTISGIVAYILRNLLQMIPFPLEGIYGFQHMRVGEVKSGMIISMFLLFMSSNLVNKIKILQPKFSQLLMSNK